MLSSVNCCQCLGCKLSSEPGMSTTLCRRYPACKNNITDKVVSSRFRIHNLHINRPYHDIDTVDHLMSLLIEDKQLETVEKYSNHSDGGIDHPSIGQRMLGAGPGPLLSCSLGQGELWKLDSEGWIRMSGAGCRVCP